MTTTDAGQTWAETGAIISPVKGVDIERVPERPGQEGSGPDHRGHGGQVRRRRPAAGRQPRPRRGAAEGDQQRRPSTGPAFEPRRQGRLDERVVAAAEASAGGRPGLPHRPPHDGEDRPAGPLRRRLAGAKPPPQSATNEKPEVARRSCVPRPGHRPARSSSWSTRRSTRSCPELQPGPAGRVHRLGRARQLTSAVHQGPGLPRPDHVPALGGAVEQPALDRLLHRASCSLGLIIADAGVPGPLRVVHQGGRVPAHGHRGHGPGRDLAVRLRPGRRTSACSTRSSAWSTPGRCRGWGPEAIVNWRADRGRDLGARSGSPR